MKVLRILCLSTVLLGAYALYGQSGDYFRQHWNVPTYYHPGQAGENTDMRLTVAGEMDATGFRKAPKHLFASADYGFRTRGAGIIGLGASCDMQNRGYLRNKSAFLQVSRKWRLGKGRIKTGLQAGMTLLTYDPTLTWPGTTTPDLSNYAATTRHANLNLALGIGYQNNRLNTDFSIHNLTSPYVLLGEDSTYTQKTALYGDISYNIPTRSSLLWLKPSLLLRYQQGEVFADLTARLFKQWGKTVCYIGLGYTPGNEVAAFAGVTFTQVKIGYSYERLQNNAKHEVLGRHELTVSYRINTYNTGRHKGTYKSVRFL